eukprot:TRINITY_DN1616_c0_g1_i1.p1 TRINITY_DN1616_c0_g1~~TRINITY_DN1616_c0_g1_i1.p1  ORF type:complete len:111 (-),score=27.95 TRINITY_DN1616_c0_g1_i1:410-742(-)
MGADSQTSKRPLGSQEELDGAEYVERYNKYEAEYVRRLKSKYFSNKTFSGAPVFDKEMIIDGEVIRASKDPATKPFIEAFCLGEEHRSPTSPGDASGIVPNKKSQSRKNG